MGTSPDVSGSRGLGRPQTLDYTEQQQTAETLVNKAGLAQVKNTLEIPFHQLGGDKMQYEAHSTKPTLARTLFAGMVRSEPKGEDALANQLFEELKEKLPLQLQMGLKHYARFPWEERPANFILLELMLKFAARAEAFLQRAEEVDPQKHLESTGRMQIAPKKALYGWLVVSVSVHKQLMTVAKKGKGLEKAARASSESVKLLTPYIKRIRAYRKETGKTKGLLLRKTIKVLQVDLEMLRRGKYEEVTSVVQTLLEQLRSLLETETMPKGGALFHALYIVGESYFTKGTHCFGPTMQELINRIASPFPTLYAPHLFALAINTWVPTVVTASHLKHLEAKEEERFEKGSFQALALKMASALIGYSGALEKLMEIFAKATLAKERPLFCASALSAAYLLLPFNARVGKERVNNAEAMLSGVQEPFMAQLEILKKAYAAGELQAGFIALEEKRSKAFFKALDNLIKEQKLDPTRIPDECAEVTQESGELLEGIEGMSQQEKFMDVIRQVA